MGHPDEPARAAAPPDTVKVVGLLADPDAAGHVGIGGIHHHEQVVGEIVRIEEHGIRRCGGCDAVGQQPLEREVAVFGRRGEVRPAAGEETLPCAGLAGRTGEVTVGRLDVKVLREARVLDDVVLVVVPAEIIGGEGGLGPFLNLVDAPIDAVEDRGAASGCARDGWPSAPWVSRDHVSRR